MSRGLVPGYVSQLRHVEHKFTVAREAMALPE
jgi:hypothetical protein